MDDSATASTQLEISPKHDPATYHDAFAATGRLRIDNFLVPSAAEAIYRQLVAYKRWRTLVVANEKLMGTAPEESTSVAPDPEILEFVGKAAANGFASVYEADRAFTEDQTENASSDAENGNAPPSASDELGELYSFLSSEPFLAFMRAATGIVELERVTAQATRFRAGHFATYHSGTWSSDKDRKRRALVRLGLTPVWKSEWGGITELRNADGKSIEGFVPCFNTLDLLRFPQGQWTSVVAPFAEGAALSIVGRLYVK